MNVHLSSPRGFCAGVRMAIQCLNEVIRRIGPDVYVYHEIIHNKRVVDDFVHQGVRFVESVDEVPEGKVLLFSAHGVSPEVRRCAQERRLQTIDATCPLVTKVHLEALRYAKEGYHIILIGHEGHDEVIGTMGEAPQSITLVENADDIGNLRFSETDRIACLTQTTLSVDSATMMIRNLQLRYPQITLPKTDDICYATTNRQESLKDLVETADVLLVVGSQNSSNSRRLQETGASRGVRSYLVDGASELELQWFEDVETVVITAGASAPETAVQECVQFLTQRFNAIVHEEDFRGENVHFPLPSDLMTLPAV